MDLETLNQKRRLVYLDTETDGLLDQVKNIWIIGCKDVDTGEKIIFTDNGRFGYYSIQEHFNTFYNNVEFWAGHNIIAYDSRVLKKRLGYHIPWQRIKWDTLILSKLINFEVDGGHSLRNLAIKAGGVQKGEYNGGWDDLNQDMITYNGFDLDSGVDVLKYLEGLGKGTSLRSIRLEHETQENCARLHENGFILFEDKAKNLVTEMSIRRDALAISLSQTHPKQPKVNRVVSYRVKKDGDLAVNVTKPLEGFVKPEDICGDYSYIDWLTFNPASRQQIVWQLLNKGWKPTKFTDPKRTNPNSTAKPQPIVSEEVLEPLIDTFPEARDIITYLMLEKRIAQVQSWLDAYNPNTGRVHSFINGIGARTRRASHSDINQAQIPSVRLDKDDKIIYGIEGTYNFECRDCWGVPDGYKLVGVDASAIQLVILAHCMDDQAFTKAVAEGKKEDGTDVHTFNRNVLRQGISSLTGKDPSYFSRSNAKTWKYAFLLGAGGPKSAAICSIPSEFGNKLKEDYLRRLPKLKQYLDKLYKEITTYGKIRNIDGAYFPCRDKHFGLAFILQGYESTIMKMVMNKTQKWIDDNNIDARIVAWVHDELQIETRDIDGLPDIVCRKVVEIIEEVGRELELKCPLTGSGSYGSSWAHSH